MASQAGVRKRAGEPGIAGLLAACEPAGPGIILIRGLADFGTRVVRAALELKAGLRCNGTQEVMNDTPS